MNELKCKRFLVWKYLVYFRNQDGKQRRKTKLSSYMLTKNFLGTLFSYRLHFHGTWFLQAKISLKITKHECIRACDKNCSHLTEECKVFFSLVYSTKFYLNVKKLSRMTPERYRFSSIRDIGKGSLLFVSEAIWSTSPLCSIFQ